MSTSRKRRRRLERERARRPTRSTRARPATRFALIGAGIIMVLAGAVLLGHGAASNAERLSRIAGILILVGVVLVAAGLLGWF